MSNRIASLTPRLFAAGVVVALSTSAAIAFAAVQQSKAPQPVSPSAATGPEVVRVPDVTGQAYVFAKGMLEEKGFAWRVEGDVLGFAANLVVSQQPVAGTHVIDNGVPTIILRLRRNADYAEHGTPENFAPYEGTVVELPAPARPRPARPTHAGSKVPATRQPASRPAAPKYGAGKVAARRPVAKPDKPRTRPPAFVAPGAPAEPLDEMTLPRRAKLLGSWVERHRTRTDANLDHWSYQHAWIVYGARFGWWHGDEALELLIRVDERVQKLWGVGSASEAVARKALAEVRAKSR
ncbi:MAG: PASTA domain-containing protein [Gaiellaceae bacterium]